MARLESYFTSAACAEKSNGMFAFDPQQLATESVALLQIQSVHSSSWRRAVTRVRR